MSKKTDHRIAKQMIMDLVGNINRYVQHVTKDSHFSIDFVFAVAVSDPEETLECINVIEGSFDVAEILINDLNKNNVASLINEGTTMCDFFKRYKKDGLNDRM